MKGCVHRRASKPWCRDLMPLGFGVAPVLHLQWREKKMPTAKKRINITVDDRIYEALERLSSERAQSVAGVGLSLIKQALEYQEDLYFSRVADERLGKKQKRIPHEKVWA
jgi:predicted DNA-binding protein